MIKLKFSLITPIILTLLIMPACSLFTQISLGTQKIDIEKEYDNLKAFVDFSESDYPYTDGIHDYEQTYRWTSPSNNFILLKYDQQENLYVETWIPNFEGYKEPNPTISINLDGLNILNYEITKQDSETIFKKTIPLDQKPSNGYAIVEISATRWHISPPTSDKRELATKLLEIGFTN